MTRDSTMRSAFIRLGLALFGTFLLAVSSVAPALGDAANIFGLWSTEQRDGSIEILPCSDNKVCARVVDGKRIRANPNVTDINNPDADKRNRPLKGLYVLEGSSGGPTLWKGGTLYDPESGRSTTDSKLELVDPTTMKMTGCVLFFCQSRTWIKASSTATQH